METWTYEVVWVAGSGSRAGMEVCRERISVPARNPLAAMRKIVARSLNEGPSIPADWIIHEVKFVSRV